MFKKKCFQFWEFSLRISIFRKDVFLVENCGSWASFLSKGTKFLIVILEMENTQTAIVVQEKV